MSDSSYQSGLTLVPPIPGAPSNMRVHDAAGHDERWFKAHPGRTHRLRLLLPDERSPQGNDTPFLLTIVKRLGEYRYIAVAFPLPEAFAKRTPAGFCKRIKEDAARALFEMVAPNVSDETLQRIEEQAKVARARDHDDAEWFASNPRRNHRLRPPSEQERAARPLPDDIMIVVRQMRPGIRVRLAAQITRALDTSTTTTRDLRAAELEDQDQLDAAVAALATVEQSVSDPEQATEAGFRLLVSTSPTPQGLSSPARASWRVRVVNLQQLAQLILWVGAISRSLITRPD